MEFTTSTKPLSEISTDLLVLRFLEGERKLEPKIKALDQKLGKQILSLIQAGDFKGRLGETLLLPVSHLAPKRMVLLGLGKKNEYTLENLRVATASLAPLIQKHKTRNITFALIGPAPKGVKTHEQASQAMVEALLLANYKFTEYKKLEEDEQPIELAEIHFVLNFPRDKARVLKGAAWGQTLARAVKLARDLGNHPANTATPTHLAWHAQSLAKENREIRVKVLSRPEIKKEKMGAFLAVAQGSDQEPKFIILEYRGKKNGPTIILVGKGLTFDSGGLSLKPSEKMEEMKNDMAGGAAVLGIIQAAAALKLPINLVGLIPATENLPSGKASKPGDIVRSRAGITIEIVNTDAEGRLVLADALDYAKNYQPDLVIDFATLTGAIMVGLGDMIAGVFSNQEKLLPKLKTAALSTGEKIWQMPLEKDYEELIKSDFADLRNIGTIRFGDAINAAIFLQNFTDYPWVHFDIAGPAWATREKPYRGKGATGFGIRLAVEFLKNFKK